MELLSQGTEQLPSNFGDSGGCCLVGSKNDDGIKDGEAGTSSSSGPSISPGLLVSGLFSYIASFTEGRAGKDWFCMDTAVRMGHIELAKYLHAARGKTVRCTHNAVCYAVQQGNLGLVRLLFEEREIGAVADAARVAASDGQMEILRWLYERNRKEATSAWVIAEATRTGNLQVVKWLCERRTAALPWCICDVAAAQGHLHILQWIREHIPSSWHPAETFIGAVERGEWEIARWLLGTGDITNAGGREEEMADTPYSKVQSHLTSCHGMTAGGDLLDCVAEHGGMELFLSLVQSYEVDLGRMDRPRLEFLANSAARGGSLELVAYLLTNLLEIEEDGAVRDCSKTKSWAFYIRLMATAARAGHVHIMDWLYEERGLRVVSDEALDSLAPFTAIEFLLEKGLFLVAPIAATFPAACKAQIRSTGRRLDVRLLHILVRESEYLMQQQASSSAGNEKDRKLVLLAFVSALWYFNKELDPELVRYIVSLWETFTLPFADIPSIKVFPCALTEAIKHYSFDIVRRMLCLLPGDRRERPYWRLEDFVSLYGAAASNIHRCEIFNILQEKELPGFGCQSSPLLDYAVCSGNVGLFMEVSNNIFATFSPQAIELALRHFKSSPYLLQIVTIIYEDYRRQQEIGATLTVPALWNDYPYPVLGCCQMAVFKFLADQGYYVLPETSLNSRVREHAMMIERLYLSALRENKKPVVRDQYMKIVAEYGNLPLLRWLHERWGGAYSPHCFVAAARGGNLDICKLVLKDGKMPRHVRHRMMEDAIEAAWAPPGPFLDVIDWILDHYSSQRGYGRRMKGKERRHLGYLYLHHGEWVSDPDKPGKLIWDDCSLEVARRIKASGELSNPWL